MIIEEEQPSIEGKPEKMTQENFQFAKPWDSKVYNESPTLSDFWE